MCLSERCRYDSRAACRRSIVEAGVGAVQLLEFMHVGSISYLRHEHLHESLLGGKDNRSVVAVFQILGERISWPKLVEQGKCEIRVAGIDQVQHIAPNMRR